MAADINECAAEVVGPCDENAECVNTAGSYECRCNDNFTAAGHICVGKLCVTCQARVIGTTPSLEAVRHVSGSGNRHIVFPRSCTSRVRLG